MKKLFFMMILSSFLFASILPKQYQSLLKKGIDVNWCLFKKEKKFYTSQVVIDFAKYFQTIRIRFNDKTNIKQLSKIINDVLQHNMIPIIAYNAKKFKQNPKKYKNKFISKWIKIAKYFKNYPYKLSYDLIIEPAKKLNKNQQLLNNVYKRIIQKIRKIDKKRIIFIAPVHASNPYYLDKLYIPNDKYIMIEWHFYAAGPSKTNKKRLWTDAQSSYEKELINKKIKYAYNFCKKHHLYSWVGAVMPGNYNHGDNYSLSEQEKFISYLTKQLSLYHIPYAINADQKFYNIKQKKWNKRVVVLKYLF